MNGETLPQKLKIPSHVMDFHCTKCGECCTNKWKIRVDVISYDKLNKKLEELDREKELHDNIQHDKKGSQIRFLDNGRCPYLSDNNLCSLQLELGEEYLLDICKVYPRNIFASQHTLEFSLFLTCKTAVRTLQQGPISITEIELPILDGKSIPFSFIRPNSFRQYCPNKTLLNNSQLPYHILEDSFIKIVQDRRYSMSQRLVTLGHEIIHLITGNPPPGDVDGIQGSKVIFNDDQQFCAETDLNRHLKQLYMMANIFLKKCPVSSDPLLLRSILLALSSDKSQQTESGKKIIRADVLPPNPSYYQGLLDQYYLPAHSTIEPILENYMVNYILSKHFYLQPLHFAYYRMAFAFAAINAFSLGYSLLTTQTMSPETTLQAIYDAENIFYVGWFYPYISFIDAGKDPLRIIENGIVLAQM